MVGAGTAAPTPEWVCHSSPRPGTVSLLSETCFPGSCPEAASCFEIAQFGALPAGTKVTRSGSLLPLPLQLARSLYLENAITNNNARR